MHVQDVVARFAPPSLSQYGGLDVNLTPASVQHLLGSRCRPRTSFSVCYSPPPTLFSPAPPPQSWGSNMVAVKVWAE